MLWCPVEKGTFIGASQQKCDHEIVKAAIFLCFSFLSFLVFPIQAGASLFLPSASLFDYLSHMLLYWETTLR